MYSPKFDWVKYLTLAEELAERHGDEAAQRSAVSRAYYAVYCRARNTLEDRQLFDRTHITKTPHQDVWDVFEDDYRREWAKIGQLGHNLKRNRTTADYNEQIRDLSRLTEGAIKLAKRLDSSLRKLPY